jgi:N6-adenosine-specific RNA methylase IME4
MTEWLKDCEICNAGLCAEMDNYIACGMSVNKAAKQLEKDQKKKIGTKLYSAATIRNRYNYYKGGEKVVENQQLQTPDEFYKTVAIEKLHQLIKKNKKFGTIYADPPWNYSNQATRASTDNHYDTLTVDEICSLPIKPLAAENSHLHLWTTNAFIFETPKILESWGFEYKSIFVWVKPQMGIGNYWRVSHEFLITAIRPGSTTFLDKSQMSWLQADRTKHSRKPEAIAQMIERVSPGPYLELFGRQTRENWTVWGNEIERDLFNGEAFKTEI